MSSTLLGKELEKKNPTLFRLRFLILQGSDTKNQAENIHNYEFAAELEKQPLLWVRVIILEITEEKENLWAAEAAVESLSLLSWGLHTGEDENHCSNFSATGRNPNWWSVPLILQIIRSVTHSSAFLFYIICQDGSSSYRPGQKITVRTSSVPGTSGSDCPGLAWAV